MQYSKTKYPDGQISVSITNHDWPYIIKERINSYEDLIYVISIAEALRHNQIYNYHLEIPCLFAQRSDRRFKEFNSFDLKIVTDIINQANFKSVKIFDPHSYVSIALINYASALLPTEYVQKSIELIASTNLVLVSPDAGAYKKVYDYGDKFKFPVVAASKHRDLHGKIDLQVSGDVNGKDCLIIDDFLDGGYTFIILSNKLKQLGANTVNLYISHAYFSKGVEFVEGIDRFFCTNSVKDIEHKKITQFKII